MNRVVQALIIYNNNEYAGRLYKKCENFKMLLIDMRKAMHFIKHWN
jgi:hypothetical protein